MWNQVVDLYDAFAGLAANRNIIVTMTMFIASFATFIKLFDEFVKQFITLVKWFKKWSGFFSEMKQREEGTSKKVFIKSSIKKWYDAI
ncbi:hypothetical protein [Bacillus bombysepticus]|uniref:hypothetical protein n=1 Tax=Bacillus bombysepticus TaxID=658666 RepID=UPI0030162155